MNEVLNSLAKDCHQILVENSGPQGREKIARLLAELLSNPEKVDALVPLSTGERELLYKDPALGFCILAHNYHGTKTSPPHDHGPSWAIYGQARGETIMSDYNKIESASAQKPGKVKVSCTYNLNRCKLINMIGFLFKMASRKAVLS